MDTEFLARFQFAFTIAFHYIFPPLSIGLGLIMVITEGMYLKTRNKEYEVLAKFWTKIFALTFGAGVVTGIVMEFEFGTNWATYSRYVGDIFGSALAAEGIFAFALESGFLGVLLFGWNRVKPWVHFTATCGVLFGSMFSAVWIVVANSWQQTPAGYHIVGDDIRVRAEVTDFWEMVFNPSSVDRLIHVWNGAFLAGAFLVLSISAWYLLHHKFESYALKSFKIALIVATIFSFAQLLSGHSSAMVVAKHQPAKLAAMEGHYETGIPMDLYLFGWVDQIEQKTSGVAIPGGVSFMVDGDFNAVQKGLNDYTPEERPTQINTIFQLYHIMIAIGSFFLALVVVTWFFWIKGNFLQQKWLLWIFVFSVLLPQIANQAGWFVAEMGRQPWVVYGLLRTSDALSKSVVAEQILFSIILFGIVYFLLFVLFIYLLNKKIKTGPVPYEDSLPDYSKRLTHV